MSLPERLYQAYLLRLWRDSAEGPWRASLQNTRESNPQVFADVKRLIAFLEAQTTATDAAVADKSYLNE